MAIVPRCIVEDGERGVADARRITLWAMRVLIVLLLIGLFLFVGSSRYDFAYGHYDLTVTIADERERPKSVYCEALRDGDTANRYLCEFLASERGFKGTNADGWNSRFLNPYEGGPIEVSIYLELSRSILFGYLQDPQVFRYLMVAAEMPDGRHTGAVIRLPDYNVSRSVSVFLP
jgi:hypothetical protein